MRLSARSAISPATGHVHVLSSSLPSHTRVDSSPFTARDTHAVTAVKLACPRFLSFSAIQDSTTGRSVSRVAVSVGQMILTYT